MDVKEKIVLHIDDDADDRELLQEVMQRVAPDLKMLFAENGLEALDLLSRMTKQDERPCLIILDLNMPYINGRDTFTTIKADPQLSSIPLVVFSSGDKPSDKALFRADGITYYNKPVDFAVMEDIARLMATLC